MGSHNAHNNKNSLSINDKEILSACQPLARICKQKPVGYVVELGSNEAAEQHLAQARKLLSQNVSSVVWSTEFVNPDYTATQSNPKPDYTNQCGYLIFNDSESNEPSQQGQTAQTAMTLGELVKHSKVIEKQIQNEFYEAERLSQLDVESVIKSIKELTNRRVIIDIDILAIKTESGDLVAIEERYPFKNHEWVGIKELYNAGALS